MPLAVQTLPPRLVEARAATRSSLARGTCGGKSSTAAVPGQRWRRPSLHRCRCSGEAEPPTARPAPKASEETAAAPTPAPTEKPAASPTPAPAPSPVRIKSYKIDDPSVNFTTIRPSSGDETEATLRGYALAAGDAAMLVLFACIGRVSHGEGLGPIGVVGTAFPFLVGWAAAAYLTNGYSNDTNRRSSSASEAALAILPTWAASLPVS
eukprot:scaffold1237_cov403-Prasinococcus_capsulatus_cf.AAC.9